MASTSMVPPPVTRAENGPGGSTASVICATKVSEGPPPKAGWKAAGVMGKFEPALPATYAFGFGRASTAMALP